MQPDQQQQQQLQQQRQQKQQQQRQQQELQQQQQQSKQQKRQQQPNVPQQPTIQAAAAQRGHVNLKSLNLSGTAYKNGWFWLEKFIAYYHRADIDVNDDDAMIKNFLLFISGLAET